MMKWSFRLNYWICTPSKITHYANLGLTNLFWWCKSHHVFTVLWLYFNELFSKYYLDIVYFDDTLCFNSYFPSPVIISTVIVNFTHEIPNSQKCVYFRRKQPNPYIWYLAIQYKRKGVLVWWFAHIHYRMKTFLNIFLTFIFL